MMIFDKKNRIKYTGFASKVCIFFLNVDANSLKPIRLKINSLISTDIIQR